MVKDKAGKVLGMLTLEDVLETLVGDIEEELDVMPTDFVAAGRGKWAVGGGVRVGSLEQSTGIQTGADRAAHLADLLEESLTVPAKPGVAVVIGTGKFTIQKVRRGRALIILVEAA